MKPGRAGRFCAGMLALAGLALLLSQAGRLPGPAGGVLRRNAADGRDAAALFYTEVDGWRAWTAGRSGRAADAPAETPAPARLRPGPARTRGGTPAATDAPAPAPRTRRGVTP